MGYVLIMYVHITVECLRAFGKISGKKKTSINYTLLSFNFPPADQVVNQLVKKDAFYSEHLQQMLAKFSYFVPLPIIVK